VKVSDAVSVHVGEGDGVAVGVAVAVGVSVGVCVLDDVGVDVFVEVATVCVAVGSICVGVAVGTESRMQPLATPSERAMTTRNTISFFIVSPYPTHAGQLCLRQQEHDAKDYADG
jgi:hypothetical protein